MFKVYRIIIRAQVLLFVAFFLVAIFVFSTEMSRGFKRGATLCFDILIPSLFPFMALSSFITKSGIGQKLDKIFSPVTKFLFNLPGSTATTILLGLIGGYPAGAVGVSNLKKSNLISESQAQRMLLFLVNAGPAFVITAVGAKLLHNVNLGIVIFLSQTLAAILLGVVSQFIFKDKLANVMLADAPAKHYDLSEAFVASVKESSQNVFNMCSFVVLFSSFMEIIKSGLIEKFLSSLNVNSDLFLSVFTSAFEITAGCNSLCRCDVPIGAIAFFLSFGGLCVHLQIFSCINECLKISKLKFLLFRVLHGLLTVPICYVLLPLLHESVQTFSTVENHVITHDFATSGVAIVFLCLCFLNTLTSENIDFKKE